MIDKDSVGQKGYYSPNQCIFFVLLVLIILIFFLGKQLSHPAQSMKNPSLRAIYMACVHPLISFTEHLPTPALIPAVRNLFITTAGLEERGEWDSFFYREEVYAHDSNISFDLEYSSDYSRSLASSFTMSDKAGIASEDTLPVELRTHVSPTLLRNAALSIPRSSRYPLRMFFFGDSQMHGLAAGMQRALGSDTSITVQELSVHSSGFLRSDYYNWPQKLENLFAQGKVDRNEKHSFDAAVLFLGMNDYQDMRTTTGIILNAGTPEWEEVYRKMVKKHLDIVLRSVPRLYWFGLPVVRKTSYNEKIRYLDSVHNSIAEEYDQHRLVKVPLKDWVQEYGTGYVGAVQAENGTWISFMQGDGIHYTIEGGEYLMKRFIAQLHLDYEFELTHR